MKTVIYHSADFDGIFCREIAKRFLGNEGVQYIGWTFGDPVLDYTLLSQPLIVLDLPIGQTFGIEFKDGWICKNGVQVQPIDRWDSSNITWIDHHKTSIETHPSSIPGYRIDGVAACRLAWQWFNEPHINGRVEAITKQDFIDRKVDEPLAARLAGEYDVWDHRGDGDLELQFGLRCGEPNWEVLFNPYYGEKECAGLILQGKSAMAYSKHVDADLVRHKSFIREWEGLKFLCLNHGRFNSLTFEAKDTLDTGHDALLGFFFNGKQWIVSMYHAAHRKDLDLSAIAVKYGGGGHKGACGFQCDYIPFL